MSERSRGDFYSGGMNEVDLLAELKVREGYLRELRALVNEKGYLAREPAMRLIREFYRDDPTNPKKPFAAELRKRVGIYLQIAEPEDWKRLKVYSAVGKKDVSPLDFFHGIDAWIEWIGKNEKDPRIVTIDATMRANKDDAKADLLVTGVPDPSEDPNGFTMALDQYAKRVATLFGAEIEKKKRDLDETRVGSTLVRRRPKTP